MKRDEQHIQKQWQNDDVLWVRWWNAIKKQKQCQNEEDMRSMMNYDKTMSMTLTRCWKLMRKMRTVAKPCRKQWRNDETWWENDEIWE